MAVNLGVHIYEQATSISTPNVASVGIPYFVGSAPAHSAESPGKANTPILATSWDEAVKKLGFSYDWKNYDLCACMYSHFQLYACQPAIFCNILDYSGSKTALNETYTVSEHTITLPFETIQDDKLTLSVTVTDADSNTVTETLEEDVDYTLLYDDDVCTVELLEDSDYYDAEQITVTGYMVNPDALEVSDAVMGVNQVDACMTVVGVVPDLIVAPSWSGNNVVAAVMATKAANISGLFAGKALIDIPCGEDGVRDYSELSGYKNKNNLVDENQILCWPQVKLGDYQFPLSVQLAGLMAQVDTGNRGIPYESPSNKNLQMDACCLEDGTEVWLTWPQVNLVAGSWGVVTAVNFMDQGWVAKGNYCACYPGNTDVKDQFIPVSRMFDFIGNTLIRTFWPKLDDPMDNVLKNNILQTCNTWLTGMSAYLYGARVELLSDENPLTSILAGIITLHVYIAPPVPAQEIDFVLEYDASYAESALTS